MSCGTASKDKMIKDYYSEVDKLALKTLKKSGLRITEDSAIKFARLFLLEIKKYESKRPEMYYILKELGERNDRRKRR